MFKMLIMYCVTVFISHIHFKCFRLTLVHIFKMLFGYLCWGVEPRVPCLLDRCSTTELHLQFWSILVFFILTNIKLSFIKIQFTKYRSPADKKLLYVHEAIQIFLKSFLTESLYMFLLSTLLIFFHFFMLDFYKLI